MSKYIDNIAKKEIPDYMTAPAGAELENAYIKAGLSSYLLKGAQREKAASRRKKAFEKYCNFRRAIDAKTDGKKIERQNVEQITADTPDEVVGKLQAAGSKFEGNEYKYVREFWKKNMFDFLDEFKKPNHGILNLKQTDEELLENYIKCYHLLSPFIQGTMDVTKIIDQCINDEQPVQEKNKLLEIKNMWSALFDFYSVLSNRYNLMLSPSYDLLGTTQLPQGDVEKILKTYNSVSGGDDLSQVLSGDLGSYNTIDSFASSASLFDLKDSLEKYNECIAFDDCGRIGTGNELLGAQLDKDNSSQYSDKTDNIYLKIKDDKWAVLRKTVSGCFELDENLTDDKQAEINRLYKARTSENNIELIANINKAVTVISKNGANMYIPAYEEEHDKLYGRPETPGVSEVLSALLKDGEVYYRDYYSGVHHLSYKGTNIVEEELDNKKFAEKMAEASHAEVESFYAQNPDNMSEEFLKLYAMEKAEPGYGGNIYYSVMLKERAGRLKERTGIKGTSEAYENVVNALEKFAENFEAMTADERENMTSAIVSLAGFYIDGKDNQDLKKSYTRRRYDEMTDLKTFLTTTLPGFSGELKKLNTVIKNDGDDITAQNQEDLADVYKKALGSAHFDKKIYTAYRAALEAGDAERIEVHTRLRKAYELSENPVIKKLDGFFGKTSNIYSAEELDKAYAFTCEIQKCIDSAARRKPETVLANLIELLDSEEALNLDDKYRNYLGEKALAEAHVINPAFEYNARYLNESATSLLLEDIFKNKSMEEFMDSYGGNKKAIAALAGVMELNMFTPEKPSIHRFSVDGNSLADKIYETMTSFLFVNSKVALKNREEEIYKAVKKAYIGYRCEGYIKQTKKYLGDEKIFISADNFSASLFGKNGFTSDLSNVLASGDSKLRGSSALYKEIQADLKKLANHKTGNTMIDARYAKAYLQAIAEKAELYLKLHADREMEYPIDSYEGKRIDNMRRVISSVNTYINSLEDSKLYKNSLGEIMGHQEEIKDDLKKYRSKIVRRFKNGSFNSVFYAEIKALDNIILPSEDQKLEASSKAIDKFSGSFIKNNEEVLKIMQMGLKNSAVTYKEADRLFDKVNNAIKVIKRKLVDYNEQILTKHLSSSQKSLTDEKDELNKFFKNNPKKASEDEIKALLGEKNVTGIEGVDYLLLKHKRNAVNLLTENIDEKLQEQQKEQESNRHRFY